MMETNLKPGMLVRVADDISKTRRRWNLDPDGTMLRMRNKVFPLHKVLYSDGVTIYHRSFAYTFCPEDLKPLQEITVPKEAVMFDPKNLNV